MVSRAAPLLVSFACLVAVGLCVLLAVINARRQRRRLEQLHRWAQRHGWTITPTPAVEWGARLPGGNRHGVHLAISGVLRGRPVSVGEYSYTETHTTSSSDGAGGTTTSTSTHTHHFIVVVARLPHRYPAIEVHPRGRISKIGHTLSGGTAGTTGNEQFDRNFRIRTADPDLARRLIGPALAAAHLAGHVPAWSIHRDELMTYHPGQLRHPEQMPALATPVVQVADLLGR